MRKNIFLTLMFATVLRNAFAQNNATLKVGDASKSFILTSYKNTVDMVSFSHNNKLVYLRFWSTDSLNSKKDFYKIKRVYKRNLIDKYKIGNGFDVIFIALDANKEKWEEEVKKYKIDEFKNYIATKGFDDYFIKQYNLPAIPYGFLINETGKIESVSPPLESIEASIEERKINLVKSANKIVGKIKQSGSSIKMISNKLLYITNIKNDTIQKVTTNNEGVFTINDIKNEPQLTINISKSDNIDDNLPLQLENEQGDIMDDFNHTPISYYVNLTKGDMNEMGYPKEMKELSYSKNLFKSGQNTLTEQTKTKLNEIISILENDTTLVVEILSHTDCKGDATLNQKLSEQRANICATYLVANRINKSRISTIGYGEMQPLNRCIDGVPCSDEELEKNRRIEFNFFKIK